jgi:hypothetical protein
VTRNDRRFVIFVNHSLFLGFEMQEFTTFLTLGSISERLFRFFLENSFKAGTLTVDKGWK